MSQRRSYQALSRMPAWGLYDDKGQLVATISAPDAHAARALFHKHNARNPDHLLQGSRVRRMQVPQQEAERRSPGYS